MTRFIVSPFWRRPAFDAVPRTPLPARQSVGMVYLDAAFLR